MTSKISAPAPKTPATQAHPLPETFLGKEPDEIVNLVKTGSDTLDQLEWLFSEIKRRTSSDSSGNPAIHLLDIQRIAEIGHYLAFDISNYLDCVHEEMRDALKAEGGCHD